MDGRGGLIARFLEASGWHGAHRRPIVGDASTRRYERLRHPDGRTAVLMDSASQPVERWLEVRSWLAGEGVRVPTLLAADPAARLLLLEDLGDRHLDEAASDPASEQALYSRALELITAMQRPPPRFLPPLDPPTLLAQLELFTEQVTPDLSAAGAATFRAAWSEVLPLGCEGPRVFVHRDLHCRNLMVLEDGTLAVIDFQDAFAGPPAYDLVSLLQDVRRDVGAGLAEVLIEKFLDGRSALDRSRLTVAMAVLGAQRAMRILGVFTRLAGSGGKPVYRRFLPRVEAWLMRNLAHPALAPVGAWCAQYWRRPEPAPG